MKTEDLLNQIKQHHDQLSKHAVVESLMLVDLHGSTKFKTTFPELDWLKRLLEFRETVKATIELVNPVKFLGDGILYFFPADIITLDKICELSKSIFKNLAIANAHYGYREEFEIKCRVVFDYGRVFMFDDIDPQGTPVDRLFRIEKFIPNGCIGLSQEFKTEAKLGELYSIGKFFLKGIDKNRQEIFLLDPPSVNALDEIIKRRENSALTDIWSLGSNNAGLIYVVWGCIDEEAESSNYSIQSGDNMAINEVLKALAKANRIEDIRLLSNYEFEERYLSENIISVGGPFYNSVSRRLMRECRSPFIFDLNKEDCPLIDQINSKEYHTERDQNCIIRQDYGFFARLKNPFNFKKNIILICGIETYGVLGAVRMMTGTEGNAHFLQLYEHNAAKVSLGNNEMKDFFLLSKFDVQRTGNISQDTIEMQQKGLLSDWTSPTDLKLQEGPI